ncbi:MAG: UDP-N-acetylglucosamine--N-acetylmuramyl-(pentapeptide) pyrophosphoryl-undecaprenol N-acetylglucosamine transferase, partial [Clostridia bacterium]|nr:UDP-N-acetylglucosamine--N-acetylmuramyl-(pentapeptide) pyrophosphoryl-undecaprenol N-acetylglucosamine transferase [Clostridia bacterium]
MKKILFTGGGSAGHVTPNIAIIKEILEKGIADVCYIGSGGLEKDLILPLKIPYFQIDPPKLVRSFTWKHFTLPARFFKAVKKAEQGLKAYKPDLVFSKGGFVSLPVVFAASKLKIPTLTHESDLTCGLANRLIAKKSKLILTSFPETAEKFKNGKYVGSPLRKEIFIGDREKALQKYGFDGKKKILLVFGGGSGSQTINDGLKNALSELLKRYDILHLCGKGNGAQNRIKGYRQVEFEKNMGDAYAVADLVVSRAGSNAAFEILALKKPALFIPLTKSSRGDQLLNAEYFTQKGLAKTLPERDISALS